MDTSMVIETEAERAALKEYVIEPVIPARKPLYTFLKRTFDVAAALAAGVVLLLPLVIIGILIKLDSKGPALFKQERLGKDGKAFYMYKFRSMRVDAEKDGPRWADLDDDRCTRLGKFLRKCRLDELPQLWNIFVGDMSIVGPRPERAYFYDQFETYIHGFRHRLAVQPGLTGLAQVNGGYDLEPEEKIVLDMQYIKERSVLMDLKIIVKTVTLVFSHEGAR
jgi:lipopolysaccharide/colanic/teichoic acid biosynthesis glycosyltransferase